MFNKKWQIESKDQLCLYMESFCRSKKDWKVGVEYEVFPYDVVTGKTLPYHNQNGPSAQTIIQSFQRVGWEPTFFRDDHVMRLDKGGAGISFEGGGQLEFASAPRETIHELHLDLLQYQKHLNLLKNEFNIDHFAIGFPPDWQQNEMPFTPDPTERNNILYRHLVKAGNYGLDIMFRTASVQVSLDFSSEADMIKKYRVATALQPIISTLFANSSLKEGRFSGYSSYRRFVWSNVSPKSYGMLQAVYDDDFGFEKYIDLVLDSPMVLLFRRGKYLDANEQLFRDFFEGKLRAAPGEISSFQDWDNHLSTLWPEVRLKNVLELRGADSGPIENVIAIASIWVGILYDQSSLDAAWDIVSKWEIQTRKDMYRNLLSYGMNAKIEGSITAREITLEILNIARLGLMNRCKISNTKDESSFINQICESLDTAS